MRLSEMAGGWADSVNGASGLVSVSIYIKWTLDYKRQHGAATGK